MLSFLISMALAQTPPSTLQRTEVALARKSVAAFAACDDPPCKSVTLHHDAFDRAPATRKAIGALDAAAREFLSANPTLLGATAPGAELFIARVSEEEIAGLPRTSISYEQRYNGVRVDDGEVVATFANNQLIAINGALLTAEHSAKAARSAIAPAAGAVAECTDIRASEIVYSRQFAQLAELRHCVRKKQWLDPASHAVLKEESTVDNDWTASATNVVSIDTKYQCTGGTTVGGTCTPMFRGQADLATAANCTKAANDAGTCSVQSQPRKVVSVPADIQGDTRRLSFFSDGGDSSLISPYPATRIADNGIYSNSSAGMVDASAYGSSWQAVTESAHERIAGVAYAVGHNSALGLWGYRYPSDDGTLKVHTWTDSASRCEGNQGQYSGGDICLNYSVQYGFGWSQVPQHEYAHYLHHSYGLGSSSCDEQAGTEGLAEAWSLMLEWTRLNAVAGDTRFRIDPGLSNTHANGVTYYTSPYSNGQYAGMGLQCSAGGRSRYAKGMMIAQVLWSLLNNRWCNGSCPATPNTLLYNTADTTAATIGRQTLTVTVDDTGSEGPINELMREWFVNLYYNTNWESAWNLRQLFLQHDTSLPNQAPIGTLDSATRSLVNGAYQFTFSGWSCDKDTPANPDKSLVHLYIGGQIFREVVSNQGSENAVAEACSDPTYHSHRFSVTIPNSEIRSRVGSGTKSVDSYAIDSDFRNGPNPNFSAGRTISVSALF